jgi:hypothetical protein
MRASETGLSTTTNSGLLDRLAGDLDPCVFVASKCATTSPTMHSVSPALCSDKVGESPIMDSRDAQKNTNDFINYDRISVALC